MSLATVKTFAARLIVMAALVAAPLFMVLGLVSAAGITVTSSGGWVNLQSTTPGTAQTGHLNITGTSIIGTGRATLLLGIPVGATAPATAAGANDGPLDLATNAVNAFAGVRTYNSLGVNTGFFAYADTGVGGSRADEVEMGALGTRTLSFLPSNSVRGRMTTAGLVVSNGDIAGAVPSAGLEVRAGGATVTAGDLTVTAGSLLMNGSVTPLIDLGGGFGATNEKLMVFHSGLTRYGFGINANEFRIASASDARISLGTWSIADGTTWAERARLDATGLGIGKTPGVALDVLGAITSSGNGIIGGTLAVNGGTAANAIAPVGFWQAEGVGSFSVNANFAGGIKTTTATGKFRNITCSATGSGAGGTTAMTAQVWNITGAASLCTCSLGACNANLATGAASCDCNTAFAAATQYTLRVTSFGDCATGPVNMICNTEITP